MKDKFGGNDDRVTIVHDAGGGENRCVVMWRSVLRILCCECT